MVKQATLLYTCLKGVTGMVSKIKTYVEKLYCHLPDFKHGKQQGRNTIQYIKYNTYLELSLGNK